MNLISTISSVLSPTELAKYVEANYKLEAPIYCKLMKKGFNDHYLIIAGSRKYVLRVYSTISCWDRKKEEKEFEVEFMNFLSENGISVSKPIKNKEGRIINTIETVEGQRDLFLMEYLVYRKYEMDEKLAMKAGEHMAKFHEIANKFESDKSRLKIDIDYLINNPLKTIVSYQPSIKIQGYPEAFERIADYATKELSALSFSDEAFGLIHGDFGMHNIFVNEEQDISLFDFDLCGYGLRAFDIATFQVFLPWEDEDPAQINAFVEGYNKIRIISQAEHTAIKLFKNFIRTIWGVGYYIILAPILGLEYFEGELDRILLRVTNRFHKELEDISL